MSGDFHASLLPWLLLALGLPLASFVACFVIKPQIGWLSPIVASLLMVATLAFCLILFVTREASPTNLQVFHWSWFQLGTTYIPFSLLIDNYSIVMLVMVVGVSTLVHIYSAGYMAHDESQGRFFSILGLFTFAMMGLVASGNLLVLFCFWELVGVSSYLLIGHWRTRAAAAEAATKAFLVNRIGDAGFIAGLMIIWRSTGTFDIQAISAGDIGWTSAAGLCIFLGAVAKSAQLPLMTWLPDAMEGPTPVSALIHAATMVAAGVFILVRLQFLFSFDALLVIATIGSLTALYSGWLALRQTDLKRILAYSTISQLGLMMIAIGMKAFDGAFLHLITHGFFKACLFLCAGAVIYTIENSPRTGDIDAQDIRNMGGLRHSFPVFFVCFCIAGASLVGLPLLSGFVSKEAMLATMLPNVTHWSGWIFIAAFMASSLLTALYTYRMIKMVFLGPRQRLVLKPVAAVLRVPSLICAALCLWFFYSGNPFAHSAWFQRVPQAFEQPDSWVTIASLAWVVMSIGIAIFVYRNSPGIYDSVDSPLDSLYNRIAMLPVRVGTLTTLADDRLFDRFLHRFVYLNVTLAKVGGLFDRYVIDGAVVATSRLVNMLGNLTRSMIKGRVQSYLFWAIASFVALIFWFLR